MLILVHRYKIHIGMKTGRHKIQSMSSCYVMCCFELFLRFDYSVFLFVFLWLDHPCFHFTSSVTNHLYFLSLFISCFPSLIPKQELGKAGPVSNLISSVYANILWILMSKCDIICNQCYRKWNVVIRQFGIKLNICIIKHKKTCEEQLKTSRILFSRSITFIQRTQPLP